ncbi:MAG: penicillin-binding protein activator LpoB [Deltaproteobacteria bacterium]|nr:penicillin-binding protein activator LpoB [Deltaproteobacteria bacterium]
MKKTLSMFFFGIFAMTAVFTLFGCSATTRSISPDEVMHYDEGYDFSDKNAIVKDLVSSLIAKPPLVARYDRPVIIVYGVANRTSEHIDTSGITDAIRQEILASGKARFVNRVQRSNIEKELAYQYGGNVSAETRMLKARQVGAEFMLSGTLRSIKKKQPKQFRLKKKVLMYYSLTLELSNLQTGLIEWTDSAEIVREASKPFIGW